MDIGQDAARPHGHGAVDGVDVKNAVESLGRDDDFIFGNAAADQSGIAAQRHYADAGIGTYFDHRAAFGSIFRPGHERRMPGIMTAPFGVVGMELRRLFNDASVAKKVADFL